jgi:DNA-binding transcriptional regulator YiaG
MAKAPAERAEEPEDLMPNIAVLLKEEIARLSRKQVRGQVDPVRKASGQHRHDIASLKRQVAKLERQVALLERKVLDAPAAVTGSNGKQIRFVAKGLRSQRERLGLSAAQYAALLGVSTQSIYNWERNVTRPRSEQVAAIAALRGMGKREAMARLGRLNGKEAAEAQAA